MAKKTPKKTNAVRIPASSDELGLAVTDLAKAIESIAEELRPLYHIEQVADNLGALAPELDGLGKVTAMSVIARYGSDEDRAAAVAYLKDWFERGTFSN